MNINIVSGFCCLIIKTSALVHEKPTSTIAAVAAVLWFYHNI